MVMVLPSRRLNESVLNSILPLCPDELPYNCKRPFSSRSKAIDSGLNFPVRSMSTLNVTGTLLLLHECT